MKKTWVRRKMFIARAIAASWLISCLASSQSLLKPLLFGEIALWLWVLDSGAGAGSLLRLFSVSMLSGFLNYLPERQKTANIKWEKNHFEEGFSFFYQIRKQFYQGPQIGSRPWRTPFWSNYFSMGGWSNNATSDLTGFQRSLSARATWSRVDSSNGSPTFGLYEIHWL